MPFDSDDAGLIRVTRRDWEKRRRVPAELAAEMVRHASQADKAWVAARAASDYAAFTPWLEKTLELKRRYVECFEDADDPYDILLDDYEPGLTAAVVEPVFERLKEGLAPLIAAGTRRAGSVHGRPVPGGPPACASLLVLERFGYTTDNWRLDPTVHPFCQSLSTADIRLTTRYDEGDLHSLFSAMHEFGHGVYERGVSPDLERTPLASGASMAMHESQSRLWENLVGRSLPFWRWAYPETQKTFPELLADVSLERFHRAVNRVRPSHIRVDADETTYGMHIILRFELERMLLAGTLAVVDVPELWNTKMGEYLGVDVPEDRLGVLQDIHWSGGMIGYFPSYQLGNVISVQIWEKVREAIPDLDEQVERGEFDELRGWLGEHVYRHGRKFTTSGAARADRRRRHRPRAIPRLPPRQAHNLHRCIARLDASVRLAGGRTSPRRACRRRSVPSTPPASTRCSRRAGSPELAGPPARCATSNACSDAAAIALEQDAVDDDRRAPGRAGQPHRPAHPAGAAVDAEQPTGVRRDVDHAAVERRRRPRAALAAAGGGERQRPDERVAGPAWVELHQLADAACDGMSKQLELAGHVEEALRVDDDARHRCRRRSRSGTRALPSCPPLQDAAVCPSPARGRPSWRSTRSRGGTRRSSRSRTPGHRLR